MGKAVTMPNKMTVETFLDFCRDHSVSPMVRLLMTTDGMVVRALEGLFLETVQLILIHQREGVIEEATSRWLGIPQGEKGITRSVWLTLKQDDSGTDQKILMAESILPLSGLPPHLYQEVQQEIQMGIKPLGLILHQFQIPLYRDQFEISHGPSPEVAKALNLPNGTPFWTRRYRLTLPSGAPWAITEILTPFVHAPWPNDTCSSLPH